MPSLDRRTGKWVGRIRAQGLPVETRSFRTKREAKDWESERRKELTSEPPSVGMDWLTFAGRYLDEAEARYITETYKSKRSLVERFTLHLGSNPKVHEITPVQVSDYLLEQARTRGNNTANADRKNLHAMWSWGQRILDLPSNPVAKTHRFAYTTPSQYVPPERDILKILSVCDRKERAFLLCYLHTAARRAEVFRWKWADDVNFERAEVRLGTRKSRDGSMEYEWLPMTEELRRELLWLYREEGGSEYVWTVDHGPCTGRPFRYRTKFLPALCKRAGVKRFQFHSLRRYAASILADKFKVSSKTIQRILRHKKLSTTEVYIKALHSDLRETMELLSDSAIYSAIQPAKTDKTGRVGHELAE